MRLEVGQEDRGTRLDRFVSGRFEDTSRTAVAAWIRSGRVQVDGQVERKTALRLRGGETVDVSPASRPPLRAEPEAIPLHILYEDDHLAVINKPAGMTVHAGAGKSSGTLVNALLYHLDRLSGGSGTLRPGIVHRLDRFTTGAIVAAKREAAQRHLQSQFQRREVRKLYWAPVQGRWPADLHGDRRLRRHGRPVMRNGLWWLRIEMPIRRDKRNRVKMSVAANGREAASDIRGLRASGQHSLVEVRIHTGRTHQVRVHLSAAGHPVVGDALYGARRATPGLPGLGHYLLHSRLLEFEHPDSGDLMRIEAPLPPEFRRRLKQLGL